MKEMRKRESERKKKWIKIIITVLCVHLYSLFYLVSINIIVNNKIFIRFIEEEEEEEKKLVIKSRFWYINFNLNDDDEIWYWPSQIAKE